MAVREGGAILGTVWVRSEVREVCVWADTGGGKEVGHATKCEVQNRNHKQQGRAGVSRQAEKGTTATRGWAGSGALSNKGAGRAVWLGLPPQCLAPPAPH